MLCQNDAAGSEDVVIPSVREGTNYTVQVGGAGNTGGPLSLRLTWFPDRDADGVLDALDKCRTAAGHRALRRLPAGAALVAADPLRQRRRRRAADHGLAIDDVPKGARAEVRCGRCGKVSRRATRTGTLKVGGLRRPHGAAPAAGSRSA